MRNWRWSRIGFLVLAIILVLALSLIGCTKTTTEENTLKVGLVCFFGWSIGFELIESLQIIIDRLNQEGGLTVGGKTYEVELVYYDSEANQAKAVAAMNRLVFEDKVKYIMGDQLSYEEAWLPTTESNKVIVSCGTTSPEIVSPKYNYAFSTGVINCDGPATIGFLAKTFPDKKTILVAYPDNQDARNFSISISKLLDTFGLSHTEVYYPPQATDLSSVGTKVKVIDPDYFMATAGGPAIDSLAFKAVRDAGWKGQFVSTGGMDLVNMLSILTPADLEGYIAPAMPTEFDPALTAESRTFKADYIAKKGEWDAPSSVLSSCWDALRAAMVKANSLDTDAIASTLSSGLEFEGVDGDMMMVSRPDVGNSRTIDSIRTIYFKQSVGGKPKLIGQVDLPEMKTIFHKAFAPK